MSGGDGADDNRQSGAKRDDAVCHLIIQASDLYEALGVPQKADEEVVKKEFRRRAREVHPDKNSSPFAAEAFRRIQRAHEVLTDKTARRRYEMTGEEQPNSSPPRPRHHPHGYPHGHPHGHYHGEGRSDFDAAQVPLRFAMIPILFSCLVSLGVFLIPGILTGQNPHSAWKGAWQGGQHYQKRGTTTPRPGQEPVVFLSRSNIEATCGQGSGKLCVVLLTAPDRPYGEREEKLLKQLRSEAERVRNSRGQSLVLVWASTSASGQWSSLLPKGASLPWIVVLKASRNGARAAPLPVPSAGGKEKGRLSRGVPDLLRDIAAGSARFEPLKDSLVGLFKR